MVAACLSIVLGQCLTVKLIALAADPGRCSHAATRAQAVPECTSARSQEAKPGSQHRPRDGVDIDASTASAADRKSCLQQPAPAQLYARTNQLPTAADTRVARRVRAAISKDRDAEGNFRWFHASGVCGEAGRSSVMHRAAYHC